MKKILFSLLALPIIGIIAITTGTPEGVKATNNCASDWKITSTSNSKYTKIRNDASDTDGVCFEGIECPEADRYSTSADISYYKPITLARNTTVQLDGLRFTFAIRNASDGKGGAGTGGYDYGDYAGFFFATTARPFSSRNTGSGIKNVMFTLFCKPYPGATQTRFHMSLGQTSDGASTYYNYPCMDAVSVQYSQPNTSSLHNWSSADSVVFNCDSYQISGKTYYNAAIDFAIDSYNSDWYKITIGQYSKMNCTLWGQNANYDSTKKTATFYLQKSYLEEFVYNGSTVMHVYGSGLTTFAYVYNLYNVNNQYENEINLFTPYLYMGENNTDQCKKYFTTAREQFLSISSGAQNYFKTNANYSTHRARYEAWGRALNQDPYSPVQYSNISLKLMDDSTLVATALISTTMIFGSIFVLVIYSKKRKAEQ